MTSSVVLNREQTRWRVFLDGMKDTIPLIVGAIPFGILFGALGINGGLSVWALIGMSLFVFAGSAQFIAVGLIQNGISASFIILTTFIVNLRHMLYAASLGPFASAFPQRWLFPLAFWLTDETYAVVIRRYSDAQAPQEHRRWYWLGSALLMYTNWQVCTLVGIWAGTQLENLAEWGLDFAMVVTFIGIVVPLVNSRPMLLCAFAAGVAAIRFDDLPNQAGLLVASLVGIAAGVAYELFLEFVNPKAQVEDAEQPS